ncbi:MAG: methyltransferase type 12 [Candidatus Contendobacter sp.]|nr:methyltransferase type 12 [Candidatus Contendobacter sp.]MDG4556899.1 methyltransferase type 12 [Candidatus Contendobacter sp.]
MNSKMVFLREFLNHPRQVASLIPSSRFLERRLVDLAETRLAQTVVELGAGTGGTTRAILRAMSPGARLLSIEINPRFCALLRRIEDPRLTVHYGGAQELREAILLYGLPAPDAVISGIPFSTLGHGVGPRIIETISAALPVGGRFVAYQVSRHVENLSRPLLGPARVEMELLNIPPLRIYRWEKRARKHTAQPFAPVDRAHATHR